MKKEADHIPILLCGARQVGKSSSVRKLGESFDYFIEVNLEKDRKVHRIFAGDLDVNEICSNLAVQSDSMKAVL